MEACGSAHHWARELASFGHHVRLMPPAYVKAYVRRQKNDAADAAAICEAVTRPSMRFISVRSVENQAALLPVVRRLKELDHEIGQSDQAILALARADETARRLMSVPGLGPVTASALAASIQDISTFSGPREFAAFLGLTPRQSSSGGKERLGRVSKMGNRYLRKLLVVGAHAVLFHANVAAMR